MRTLQFKTLVAAIVSAACLAAVSLAQAGPLQVGAARVDITPMAYPDGNIPTPSYEHEMLYIRAIVVDNGETKAVLIGSDMSGIRPDSVYQEAIATITSELGIPAGNVIMSGTHTHSGPREHRDPEQMYNYLVEAVRAANASLQPATMGFGEGAVYLNVNRDVIDADTRRWTQAANLDAPSDKTLAVLAFYDTEGNPIAGYMNYAAHPVTAYLSGFRSGDFAGAASRHVELAFGDNMVMAFVQGASGDQNPLHLRTGTNVMAAVSGVEVTGFEMNREPIEGPLREELVPRGEQNPAADNALKAWIDAMGQVMGEEAIRVMSHMDRLANDVEIAGELRDLTCPGRVRVDAAESRYDIATFADGPDVTLLLGALTINDVALASVNAEIYNIIGQQVKAASPLRNTMLVTVANGRAGFGYIPSDDAFGRQTFQVTGTNLQPGCAQTGMVNTISDMIYDQAF